MTQPAVRYRVLLSDPAAHRVDVQLTVNEPDPDGQRLRLPAWIPGSYMIREFAKNLVWVRAHDERGPVELVKEDKDTWRAAPTQGALTVTVRVHAWDLSVRAAHVDRTHAFLNGTSLFLAAVGQEHLSCELELVPPDDPACANWQVATTMPRTSGADWSFGTFLAADYEELVDHPIECGTFARMSFTACGVVHDVAITGRHRCDEARLMRDLEAICTQHIRMFGEPAPVQRYLFLVMAVGDGYGGLEHRSSTALICKRTDLPQPGDPSLSDGYRGFLGLCSHEYFHTWNVKRIKPRAFVPMRLDREAHTTLLWAFEGITSYVDDLGVLRSGAIGHDDWLELVGRTATRVQRGQGRLVQSLSESSFDAWTKFYRQDHNAPNAIVSYYAKGALVALALDLELRRRSDGRVSLDDVMRALWDRYGDGSGVPEDGVEAVASELLGDDLTPFFDQAVRGTDDLAWAELLAPFGLAWNTRPAKDAKDRGGKPANGANGPTSPGDLGVAVGPAKGGAKLRHVHDGSPAQQAGLAPGDVVVAVDGLRVDHTSLPTGIRALPAGTTVRIHAFRRDELLEVQATLREPPHDTVWISWVDDVDDEVAARRAAWLGEKRDTPKA